MVATTAAEVVVDAGVSPTPEMLALSRGYLDRVRRGRWIGVAGGLVAGFGPLAGDADVSLLLPRLIAGYLCGLLLSELISPRRLSQPVRVASLRARTVTDLLPRRAQWLPVVTLVPLLASPLLAIGWHPRGWSHVGDDEASCSASSYWPRTSTLFVIAGLAGVGLLATWLILRRLAGRAQPADDDSFVRLDRELRARSARSAIAASTSLGLALLGVIGSSIDNGVHSLDCNRPLMREYGGLGNVYSWGPTFERFYQPVSILLLLLVVPTWMICKRLRTPSVADELDPR